MVLAIDDVKCAKYWKANYVLTRDIFTLLKLLCFSDLNKVGMDKLYFYLHRIRLFFLKSKNALEDTTLFLDSVVDGTLYNDPEFSDSEPDNEEELEEEEGESEVYGGQE